MDKEEYKQFIDSAIKMTDEQLRREIEIRYAILNCDYCGGSGYDSYPNHSTTPAICPKCGDLRTTQTPKV